MIPRRLVSTPRCNVAAQDKLRYWRGSPYRDNPEQESPMSRLGCTFLLAAALPVLACSKKTESAAGAPAPTTDGAPAATSDLATAAGLTNMLTSKLGISETQATAAVGSVLSLAKGQLSPKDYGTLSTAIPGAEGFLSAAPDVAVAKAPDTVTPPAAD